MSTQHQPTDSMFIDAISNMWSHLAMGEAPHRGEDGQVALVGDQGYRPDLYTSCHLFISSQVKALHNICLPFLVFFYYIYKNILFQIIASNQNIITLYAMEILSCLFTSIESSAKRN